MLKVLIYENDLMLLYKLKSLLTSVSVFHEIKISNDEETCLNLIKNEYFDVFILKITNDKFKEKLISFMPNITSWPLLCTSKEVNLDNFMKCSVLEFSNNEFKLLPFLTALSELIPSDVLKVSHQLIEEYVPVRLSVIRKIKMIPCDLHIKLGSQKYIKIINAEEEIQPFFLDRYENKSVNEFYLKKVDFYKHSNELFANTLPPASMFETKTEYYSQSQQVIKDIVSEIGVNENTIKLADELVDSALAEYKDAQLGSLLDKFKYSKDRYIYDHGVLTSIFAISLCEKFEWRNKQNMQKIVFASLFHDFGFVDAKLAFFETNFKENLDLTKNQRNEILKHPEKIVELLSKNKEIPGDVLSLISKHHEAHGEASYPLGLSSMNLSILECVFLVAHEFANELYKIAFRPDKMDKAIENVATFSNTGNLKQVRSVFLGIFSPGTK